MTGTKIGGLAAAATNKKKYGADFYARIGASGGKVGRTGGFYANRDLARKAGAKGGRIGTRKGIANGEGLSSKSLRKYKEQNVTI